jgi:hypothetical protein
MTTENTALLPAGLQKFPAHTSLAGLFSAGCRMQVLTYLFALLLGTGLHLEFFAGLNWNSGEVILLLHIVFGLIFTALFLIWIVGHIRQGQFRSQRRFFTGLSWFLIAKYILIIATGFLMALPPAIYLTGTVWFWQFETTYMLTFLHLWGAIVATTGLLVHLGLRHWRKPASSSCRGER